MLRPFAVLLAGRPVVTLIAKLVLKDWVKVDVYVSVFFLLFFFYSVIMRVASVVTRANLALPVGYLIIDVYI